MTGLPGYQAPAARPAPPARTIFRALADLRLIPAHDGNPATIPKPAGVQARLLDLLKIDISRPRWLTRETPCAKNLDVLDPAGLPAGAARQRWRRPGLSRLRRHQAITTKSTGRAIIAAMSASHVPA